MLSLLRPGEVRAPGRRIREGGQGLAVDRRQRIVDLYEKESKGRTMTFVVIETVWRDEKSGEPAVTERFNLIHRS